MPRQYGREAQALIFTDTETIDLSELRFEFVVTKSFLGSLPNVCTLTIYNLSRATRDKLKQYGKSIQLHVGYDGEKSLLFAGGIRHVRHEVEQPEILTIFDCWSGLIPRADATISKTFAAGTPGTTVLNGIIETFGLPSKQQLPALNSAIDSLTFCGSSVEAMNEFADANGLDWNISDDILEVSGQDLLFDEGDEAIIISAETGMIGSPTVSDSGVAVQTLLNPRIQVKRKVIIRTSFPIIQVGQIEYRPRIPTLALGEYSVGEVISTGDTWGNQWTSRIKTFLPGFGL